MSPGPIPLTEIEAYFRLYGIRDHDTADEWLQLIREMDREYLSACAERREQDANTHPPNEARTLNGSSSGQH